MKLAAQMYTLRNYCKTEEDIEKTLRRLKEIGYNAIQISGFGPYRVEWLADLLRELDMEVCVPHLPYERIVGDTDALIAEMKMIGSNGIGVGSLVYDKKDSTVAAKIFDELAPAIDKIHEAGLVFAFHNHWGEFLTLPDIGMNTFDQYAARFPADRAQIILDFYWVVYACQDPIKTIEKYKDRLNALVHFKDMTINENGERMYTEVFEGFIDYEAIFRKLEECGAKWVAVEEDKIPNDGDPFEALARSLKNIKERGLPFENI